MKYMTEEDGKSNALPSTGWKFPIFELENNSKNNFGLVYQIKPN